MKDHDDLYMEYEDLVEAGEIDPTKVSAEDYCADYWADACDRAMDAAKDRWMEE